MKNEIDKYKESAGVCIIYENKILLIHPSGRKWTDSFSFPKGGIEQGESIKEAAIREVYEEVGIRISIDDIPGDPHVIDYANKKGVLFKKVYYFILEIDNLDEIGLTDLEIPKSQLQATEVDWAGFIDESSAEDKIFWRYENIFEHVNKI